MSLLALNQPAEMAAESSTTETELSAPAALSIEHSKTSSVLGASVESSKPVVVSTAVSDVLFSQQSATLAVLENRTVMTTSQASVATAAQSTAHDHLSSAFEQVVSSTATNPTDYASIQNTSAQSTKSTDNLSFDPIVIRNQKTFSIAHKNPNMEIIVLPPIHTQYQHILPKPSPACAPDPVPTSFHVSGDTVAPIYNFVKPSPQQEAQKFFGQLNRPYHQQLSQIDQLYLVDRSEKSPQVKTPQAAAETELKGNSETKGNEVLATSEQTKSEAECESVANTSTVTKTKDSFESWDQKIRKSIAETDFKTPPPPDSKKKKRRSKDKIARTPKTKIEQPPVSESDAQTEDSLIPDDQKVKKRKKKRRKSKKDKDEKSIIKSKKKKKKRDNEKDSLKKPPITPEFVNESLSSGGEESVASTPRIRHMSESDSVMAESLLKSFNHTSNLPKSPQNCSTPVTSKVAGNSSSADGVKMEDAIKPSFIEENANSSFDIDEASRPKPVIIPEGSQNSCSCHGSHYKDAQKSKCSSSKTFSFKDQDNVDSPRNYNENSSITVSAIFPTISSSSVSVSPKAEITDRKSYRNQKQEDDSENEHEEAASDDSENREKTSKLPPLSSQEKDLLDSSDDEQNSSAKTEEPQLLSEHNLSKSGALSESDVDSPLKKSPIKSPKLKIVPLMVKSHSPSLHEQASSKSKTIEPDDIVVSAEHIVEDNDEELATELEKNEELPSFLQLEDEINDSQELVIDGDEIAPQEVPKPDIRLTSGLKSSRSSRGKDRKLKGQEKSIIRTRVQYSNLSAAENNKNTENTASLITEDSCDVWYQNIQNKMTPKASFTCEICHKSFPSLAVLSVHSKTCSKTYLVCTNCGRKCSSKSGLTLHKKSCLKERRMSSGENSKIKISPGSSKSGSQKKSFKKKKVRSLS